MKNRTQTLIDRIKVTAYLTHARDQIQRTDMCLQDKQDFIREIQLLIEAYQIKQQELV